MDYGRSDPARGIEEVQNARNTKLEIRMRQVFFLMRWHSVIGQVNGWSSNFQRMTIMTGSGRRRGRFSSSSGDDGHFIGLLAFPPAGRLTNLGSVPEFDKVYLRSDKVVR